MNPKNSLPQFFAAAVLAAIAAFLVIYTWLPPRDDLQREEAVISAITPQRNTWFEVVLMTDSGVRIACRTRRGWPLVGPSRCPLEALEPLVGQSILVLHDGKRPYEIRVGSQIVLDFSAHRNLQVLVMLIAAVLLMMAVRVVRFSFTNH